MLHCGRALATPVARVVLRPVRGGNALGARHSMRCNRVLNHGGLGGGGFLLRRPYLAMASSDSARIVKTKSAAGTESTQIKWYVPPQKFSRGE
jgi:hypothetical protein